MDLMGKKIRSLRKNKNMTQEQLAEVLSVSSQSISKWENCVSAPDITLLPVIARYFGITMDELFNYRLDALNYKERFIRFMADNGVLKFGEFLQLQSGRMSPYFINTGNYKSGSQISKLGEFYAECIREHNLEGNLLIGDTSHEIPVIVATSMVLHSRYGMDIDYCIDKIAGKIPEKGEEAILLKDTLTSGSTLKATLDKLKQDSIKVTSVIVAVDRMEKGEKTVLSALHEIEKMYDVKIYSIVTLEDIIRALENGVITGAEYLNFMKKYKEEYGGE